MQGQATGSGYTPNKRQNNESVQDGKGHKRQKHSDEQDDKGHKQPTNGDEQDGEGHKRQNNEPVQDDESEHSIMNQLKKVTKDKNDNLSLKMCINIFPWSINESTNKHFLNICLKLD